MTVVAPLVGNRPYLVPPPPARLRVEAIYSYDAFVAARAAWDRLVERAGITHPFLDHDWLRSWWEAFGAGKKLEILLVWEGSELVAIAPLMNHQTHMYGIAVREIAFLANDHSPRCDFIVARNHTAVHEVIWRHLWDRRQEWDVIRLCQLVSDSPALADTTRLAADSGCHVGLWPSTESPYLSLAGNFDSCFASLARGVRANLRRRLKRLEELGTVEFERVTDPNQLDAALADAFKLEASAWKGSQGTAIDSQLETRKFYSLLARRAARRKQFYLAFLRLNGERVASDLSLLYNGTLFKLKPGYAQHLHAFSPGAQLTSMTIRDAFQQGLQEVDFLGSVDAWKLDWTEHTRKHYWAFVFQNRMPGLLLHNLKFQLFPWLHKQEFYETHCARLHNWVANLCT